MGIKIWLHIQKEKRLKKPYAFVCEDIPIMFIWNMVGLSGNNLLRAAPQTISEFWAVLWTIVPSEESNRPALAIKREIVLHQYNARPQTSPEACEIDCPSLVSIEINASTRLTLRNYFINANKWYIFDLNHRILTMLNKTSNWMQI